MSVFHENMLIGASGQAPAATGISRSIRLNAPDSAYLSRTPASAGNRKTWTWAGWVKRSGLNENAALFGRQGTDDTNTLDIRFGGDKLRLANFNSYLLETSQEFRDLSAWFHLMIVLDTTQATANNRARMYMNGLEITQFNARTNPTQNADLAINTATLHHLGATVSGGNPTYYFNGYLADIYFIDGQALTPSSFTETDATTGQLVPKAYTGSYGTNGFRLTFADNSAATATTLGKDAAGSNNWTPNNLSVTAGAGNDSLVDVPTNGAQTDTGVGGEVRGNYATLNPLATNSSLTLANGNLTVTGAGGSGSYQSNSTISVSSSKWYFEVTLTTAGDFSLVGISQNNGTNTYPGNESYSYAYQLETGNKGNSTSFTAYGSTLAAGDVLTFAVDLDNNKIFTGKNGTWFASSNPVTGANPMYSISAGTYQIVTRPYKNTGTCQLDFNFGARSFAYTAPSGFKALNTANLPAPLVTKPNTVMDVVLYTGTGSSLTLPYASSTPTSIAFTPDLVWIKGRSGATDHALYDAVRDVQKDLASNSTAAETTQSTGLTAFGTNTFTIGSLAKLNTSSATYAAWTWDAGSSTVTNNTAGTITPTGVRANATAGFSVVTYTADNSNTSTVGHGLGVKPALIIHKQRNNGTEGWRVYHISRTSNGQFLSLQGTAGFNSSTNIFPAEPTSTVFTPGNEASMNSGSYNCLAYCFAPVVGYSSFGSYTGNGSADGPFVYTGFRPRYLLIKNTSTSGDPWIVRDTARDSYNSGTSAKLAPNESYEENNSTYIGTASQTLVDFVSNGFKVRSTGNISNTSTYNYIWAAFAESPFNYARAR